MSTAKSMISNRFVPNLSLGCVTLLALALGALDACGQVDSVLPAGPLPATAPNFSQWVVTYSYPGDKDKATASNPAPASLATRVQTITTTKTGDIIHEEVVNGSGTKSEAWYVGSTLYNKSAGSLVWNEMKLGVASGYVAFPSTGYRDLDWITKESFVGKLPLSNRACLLFIPGPSHNVDPSETGSLDALPTYALLDADSHLPVKVQSDGSTRFYQFMAPPTEKLTLPPDLTDQLKKAEEAELRLNQRMPRPY